MALVMGAQDFLEFYKETFFGILKDFPTLCCEEIRGKALYYI